MASGWTGSRRLFFRLRAESYVAPIKTSLLNGTSVRVTIWANESHGLPCPLNQATASLILNFPMCRQKPMPRFKRSVYKPRSRLPATDARPPEEQHLARAVVNPNGCQVVSLVVNIWALGWREWVLAPHSFTANKCFGKCRFPTMQLLNSTNHSTLLTMASDDHRNSINYQACCVPIRYASQSVLYFDSYGHVVLKAFDSMRVVACGCR
ncbi:protein DVR-1-like [Dermacentor variabilis]|uniref:protein DVR-1-like n=1 Tax=Dermacentor variabilis TaxID=34621 RepID=UPI003F5BE782